MYCFSCGPHRINVKDRTIIYWIVLSDALADNFPPSQTQINTSSLVNVTERLNLRKSGILIHNIAGVFLLLQRS